MCVCYSILIFIAMNRGDWSTTRKEIFGMLVPGGIVYTVHTYNYIFNSVKCALLLSTYILTSFEKILRRKKSSQNLLAVAIK